MTRPRILTEQQLQLLGKEAQHGYLLRVRHFFYEGELCHCPTSWLAFVTMAYFDGLTTEIEGTEMMDTYRDILFNQLTP